MKKVIINVSIIVIIWAINLIKVDIYANYNVIMNYMYQIKNNVLIIKVVFN